MNGKQGFYQENSGIGRSLKDILSVDASRISSSNSSNEVLKVMNERFEALRIENETARKKQDELLAELRFARMEITKIKQEQEKDSHTLSIIWEKCCQLDENLQNPATFELGGHWQKTCSMVYLSDLKCHGIEWLNSRQYFRIEGNSLTWSHSQKKQTIVVAKVRVGSDRCKIKEGGKIEIKTDEGQEFELEAKGNSLVIQYHENMKINYKKPEDAAGFRRQQAIW